jgi:hypothetical protein
MHRVLTSLKRLRGSCFSSINQRFVQWTVPSDSSLLLEAAADLTRMKHELIAENAFLRQQHIILKRQVNRTDDPCSKHIHAHRVPS